MTDSLAERPGRRRPPTWRALLTGALLSAIACAAPVRAAAAGEYEIKAAFLFNFAQFVEWPATAFESPEAPLAFCVLGRDPFGRALEEALGAGTIGNRKLTVRRSNRANDLRSCQVVFVSASERPRLREVLAELEPGAVLTVSEIEGFGQDGGIINFYLDGNRVRFEINPAAAQREGLKISADLLRLGRLVDPTPRSERAR